VPAPSAYLSPPTARLLRAVDSATLAVTEAGPGEAVAVVVTAATGDVARSVMASQRAQRLKQGGRRRSRDADMKEPFLCLRS
jgi:Mrp family chromosome partitioning ATPase